MNLNIKKHNYAVIIAVILVFVSFLVAVKLLADTAERHYDNELIVCLDAGHGGDDVGAVSTDGKRYEKDDNLALTLKVRDELELLGIKTVLTREEDKTVSLRDRCRIANKKRCDLFVAIHRNSSASGTGFEAWISKREKEDERSTAKKLTKQLSELTGLADRGVKNGYRDRTANNYYVNANTNMPSILLEVGFISSDEDNRAFDENIDKMAVEIAKVIYDSLQN
ncbi:MAG: N-acetylmuramoyl-L-alanine amidase [Clostridia bacterium]|nr:N-acetylmuramoyl-L-alanine amidase [Clostridia bacterium]